MGAYRLELRVDGVELTSRYLEVGRIIKPAYRVDLTTGRRVYVAGDRIRVTATARFFEGTPVPGVPIRLDGDLTGSMTTDASGTATVRKTVRWGIEDEPRDGPRLADIERLAGARRRGRRATGVARVSRIPEPLDGERRGHPRRTTAALERQRQ